MNQTLKHFVKRGTYIEVLCESANGTLTHGVMHSDGLLYCFDQDAIMAELNTYPADDAGWFFNEGKDRYIAERTGLGIMVNPVFVDNHFIARHY